MMLRVSLPVQYRAYRVNGHMNTIIGVRNLLMRIAGYIYGQTASIQAFDLRKIKLCALVIIGVNERGLKQFLAIEDGVRESTQSWREVLLKLKSRGMNIPQLAIGDGAMGFWAAMDEIFLQTRQQRCWVHKTANILNSLPKSSQPK